MKKLLIGSLLALTLLAAQALAQPVVQGRAIQLPTRAGVTSALWWQPTPGARATVLLLPGGRGGFGRIEDGRPTGANFLVRSAALFAAQGFNVAILGRPSDRDDLDFASRIGADHLADIERTIEFVRREHDVPVWLVGTSRGSISAAAAAIRLQGAVAGLVLSASVTARDRPGGLPTQDLAAIRVPTLVIHHREDACPICRPGDTGAIVERLVNAPAREHILVEGGGPPRGDRCEALHWHGFVGVEAESVARIAEFVRRPSR
jgi:pimeloyl-ACP methyl ester carboxylesterase